MSGLKILGGHARGIPLDSPPQEITRPLQILLKRRLFDRYQDFSEVDFIDLCSGSGSVGLEASSRNARQVHLIEKDPTVYKILQKNIAKLEKCLPHAPHIFAYNQDALKFLKNFEQEYLKSSPTQQENTILFFAPPYPLHELYESVLAMIVQGWFKGVLWLEGDHEKSPGFERLSQLCGGHQSLLEHGQSYIIFRVF